MIACIIILYFLNMMYFLNHNAVFLHHNTVFSKHHLEGFPLLQMSGCCCCCCPTTSRHWLDRCHETGAEESFWQQEEAITGTAEQPRSTDVLLGQSAHRSRDNSTIDTATDTWIPRNGQSVYRVFFFLLYKQEGSDRTIMSFKPNGQFCLYITCDLTRFGYFFSGNSLLHCFVGWALGCWGCKVQVSSTSQYPPKCYHWYFLLYRFLC